MLHVCVCICVHLSVVGSHTGVRGGVEGVHGYQLPAGRQNSGKNVIREGKWMTGQRQTAYLVQNIVRVLDNQERWQLFSFLLHEYFPFVSVSLFDLASFPSTYVCTFIFWS